MFLISQGDPVILMIKLHHIAVITSLLVLLSGCLFDPLPFDEGKWIETVEKTKEEDLYKKNSNNHSYFNPWLPQPKRPFSRFLRWRFSTKGAYSEEARKNLPTVIPNLMERIQKTDPADNFLVWIGHATFLFRVDGAYWLTDPIFSDRALLPKRVTPPAIKAEELQNLPSTLNVIISHNHYDHLDADSIKKLPENARYFVPKGLGDFVASLTSAKVSELNWWEQLELGDGTKLTCLPAQHWSRRVFQGYNSSLWASFMVSRGSNRIYFGGDSGYFKGYREIGKKFETIDYALLPITAYHPRWFMHYPHMDTREAIRAFQELGAKYFIPTQWGTFHLGDNPPGLPPLELQENLLDLQLDPAPYLILDIGEILLLES